MEVAWENLRGNDVGVSLPRRLCPSLSRGGANDPTAELRSIRHHPAGVKNVIDVCRLPLLTDGRTDTLGGIEISELAAAASPVMPATE